jgi:hypothetical protein
MTEYISNPKPLWNNDETQETPTKRIVTLGGNSSGIVVRVTKKGIEFNGYYAGITEPKKYANLRDFVFVSWDDFDKLRKDVFRKKPLEKKQKIREPDSIDSKPDKKYLESLPQVTMNKKKYYIDLEKKERRPVANPEQVFNFENQAAKEPS